MPSSPNGPWRTGKTTSSAGGRFGVEEPRPLAGDLDRDDVVAVGVERLDHRAGRVEGDLVLAGAPAHEHRYAEPGDRRSYGLGEAADDDGHGRARAAPGAAGRILLEDDAVLGRVGDVLEDGASTRNPASAASPARRRKGWSTTSGTVTSSGPVEIVIVTVEPFAACTPGVGALGRDEPRGRRVARRLGRRRPRSRLPRARRGRSTRDWPSTSGTSICFDALGDANLDLGALVDQLARPSGPGRSTCPTGFCEKTSTRFALRPTSLRASTRVLVRRARRASAPRPVAGPVETVIVTVLPLETCVPSLGLCSMTMPVLDLGARLLLDLGLEPGVLDLLDGQVALEALDEGTPTGAASCELVLDLVVRPPAGEGGGGDQERDEEPRHPAPPPARRLVVRARRRVVRRRRGGVGGGGGATTRVGALREELGRLARRVAAPARSAVAAVDVAREMGRPASTRSRSSMNSSAVW